MVFLLFSTAFAISNVVCAFSYVIFRIPLPEILLKICNPFRASGRLFWSVNYMLVLLAIIHIFEIKKERIATIFLVVLLLIQVVDLSGVISIKREYFARKTTYYDQSSADEIVSAINGNDVAFFLEFKDDRALCGQLLKNGVSNNLWLISRDNYGVEKQKTLIEDTKIALLSGNVPFENCTYLTSDEELAEKIDTSNENLLAVKAGGYYCLVPIAN